MTTPSPRTRPASEAAALADMTALAATLPNYRDQNPPEAPMPTLESALCAHCFHLADQHTSDVLASHACTVSGCGCPRLASPSLGRRLREGLGTWWRRHVIADDPRPAHQQISFLDRLERHGAARMGVA